MCEPAISRPARPSDLHNLEDELRREVSMRRTVFARQVRDGKMDQRQADYRTQQMERLVVLMEALQHPDTVLSVRVSPQHIAVLTAEQISDWLASPAAWAAKLAAPATASGGPKGDRPGVSSSSSEVAA